VTELAIQLNVTAYDASYLHLARLLGARLVTFDVELGRAFHRSS
jgi:predicted nucleic acid-binding protein